MTEVETRFRETQYFRDCPFFDLTSRSKRRGKQRRGEACSPRPATVSLPLYLRHSSSVSEPREVLTTRHCCRGHFCRLSCDTDGDCCPALENLRCLTRGGRPVDKAPVAPHGTHWCAARLRVNSLPVEASICSHSRVPNDQI
jgi:hypothetical protein